MSEERTRDAQADDTVEVDAGRNPGSPALYVEMLPLVEAGASVEQAARRFGGDADEVDEIAAGFLRWQREEAGEQDGRERLARALAAAEQRISDLEDENRMYRRRMADLRRLITQSARVIEGD